MRVRLLTSALLISGAFAFSSLTAVAQDKKGHDHKDHKHTHPTAQNGGILEDVGEFHVELVAKDGKITLFLRDEDAKDAPTEGFKATVLLTAGSQRGRERGRGCREGGGQGGADSSWGGSNLMDFISILSIFVLACFVGRSTCSIKVYSTPCGTFNYSWCVACSRI